MNKEKISIIICCAGLGSRLEIGTTKALLDIHGKPLILHQLDLLKEFDDIRIVIGHQAKKVIDVVKAYRKDIMFVFNYEYANTGPAASLSKGLLGAREYIISMDGDLIIKPEDFQKFIEFEKECIAVSKIYSEYPIKVKIENGKVIKFKSNSEFEWTGLAKVKTSRLQTATTNIYDMLEPLLPLPTIYIESHGIDTKLDYNDTLKWIEKGYKK